MKPRGFVLWSGPSRIHAGQPIVAIATMKTSNRKTGPLVQTWILRADMDPVTAVQAGADGAICGGCFHRGSPHKGRGRSCYVNVGQAPLAIYRAYVAGRYSTEWGPETFAGLRVRLGAYGDPAAVPVEVWTRVLQDTAGHTGYTHQWKSPRLRDVLAYCQASVDTAEEFSKARALPVVRPDLRPGEIVGGGTFRVLRPGETLQSGEILCPSLDGVQCADCMMCDGTGSAIAIPAHGSGARHV